MIYTLGLALDDLDPCTRTFMVSELNADLAAKRVFLSPWLTPEGRRQWPDLLRIALHAHDASWLADTLEFNELLRGLDSNASVLDDRVPPTAARTLAEEQFHGYYVRGICCRAIDTGRNTVTVCRTKAPPEGSRAAEGLVDSVINATALLEDLRNNPSVAPAARFLGGACSGLSVRVPSARPEA